MRTFSSQAQSFLRPPFKPPRVMLGFHNKLLSISSVRIERDQILVLAQGLFFYIIRGGRYAGLFLFNIILER